MTAINTTLERTSETTYSEYRPVKKFYLDRYNAIRNAACNTRYKVAERPFAVISIIDEQKILTTGGLIEQGVTGSHEEPGVDWSWEDGVLYFHGRFGDVRDLLIVYNTSAAPVHRPVRRDVSSYAGKHAAELQAAVRDVLAQHPKAPFDARLCYHKGCRLSLDLHTALHARGVASEVVRLVGWKGNKIGKAHPRWQGIPPDRWCQYALSLDERVIDLTHRQFQAQAPVPTILGADQIDKLWDDMQPTNDLEATIYD